LYDKEKVVVIRDLSNDPRVQYHRELQIEGVPLIMDLLLHLRADVAGLLRLYFSSPRNFCAEDLDFATSLAEQCACAIDKVRLIHEQQAKYDQ
jgi:GAF domain-containing protein